MSEFSASTVSDAPRTAAPSLGELSVKESTSIAVPSAPPMMLPRQVADGEGDAGFDVRRILHAIRRRWFPAVIIGSLVGAAAAIPTYLFMPRGYEAVVWLRIRSGGGLLGNATDMREYEAYRKTQIQLLRSPVVLNAALRRPGISSLRTITEEEDPVKWLADSLQTMVQQESEVLQLTLRAPVAEDASKILNAVTACYLDDIVNKDRQERLQRRDTLEKKYKENQTELRSKKETFNDLARTLGTRDSVEVGTQRALLMEQVGALRSQLRELQREKKAMDVEAAALAAHEEAEGDREDGGPVDSSDPIDALVAREPEVRDLQMRIEAIAQSIQSQASRSARGMNEPGVKRLLAQREQLVGQLAAAQKRVRPRLAAEFGQLSAGRGGTFAAGELARRSPAGMVARRELLDRSIADLESELEEATREVTALGQANADLEVRRSEIEQLERVNNQIGLQLESQALDLNAPARVTLLEEAPVPNANDGLFRGVVASLAGLAGLLLGGGVVILLEYARNRLSSPDEIQQRCGMRVVGTVPWVGGRAAKGKANEYKVAESIDGIRTMLLQGTRDRPKVIMVTSPADREGKSSVAANLAASIARSGQRTLLVDASLRSPTVQAALQLDPTAPGFSELLRGEVAATNDVVQPTVIDGLFAVTAGNCDYDAIVALSKPDLARIIKGFRDTFEYVVIDAGSVLSHADSLIIGQQCDAALIATMRDVSTVPLINAASDRLNAAGIRVTGCVVSGMRSADSGAVQRRIAG